MANFTGFENGKSYTLENLTTGKMLNLYGGRTDPGTNVCQYTADNSDDQKWTFFNNKFYAYGSSEKCLDKYTSSGNAKNNNADIWKNNDDENQIVEIIRVTVKTGLVIIKLKQGNYYLTAYTGKDYPGDRNMNLTANTDAGKTPTSAGNVYWADNSEGACIWIANEVDTSTGGETGGETDSAYTLTVPAGTYNDDQTQQAYKWGEFDGNNRGITVENFHAHGCGAMAATYAARICTGNASIVPENLFDDNIFCAVGNEPYNNWGRSATYGVTYTLQERGKDDKVYMEQVYSELHKGNPIIIVVSESKTASGVATHFVVAYGLTKGTTKDNISSNRILVFDPWTTKNKLLSDVQALYTIWAKYRNNVLVSH
jgi:ricin-type beta-trefoil lectin domain